MKYLFHHTVTLLLAIVFLSPAVTAQFRMNEEPVPNQLPPSVLYPEPTYWWLGFVVGADINSHAGDFETVLCNRIFEEAEGEGVYLGVQLEHRMNMQWHWVLRLAYNDYAAKGSYTVPDVPTLVISGGEFATENIEHTYSSEVKLSYLSINPMIEFFPVSNLYLFAGPGVGVLMQGSYNCLDEVPDEYEFVRNEETIAQEDGIDIPEAGTIRLDLRGGIGYNLRLSRSVIIAPEVGYNLALTKISDDDDWAANAFTAVVVLKIDL